MEHNQNMIAAINHRRPIRSNFITILDFFISHSKDWPLSRGYFGCWGCALVAVEVVERFKQEIMYGLSAGIKKIAVIGGSTLLIK